MQNIDWLIFFNRKCTIFVIASDILNDCNLDEGRTINYLDGFFKNTSIYSFLYTKISFFNFSKNNGDNHFQDFLIFWVVWRKNLKYLILNVC